MMGRKENSLAVSRVEKDKIGTPLKIRIRQMCRHLKLRAKRGISVLSN